MRRVKLYSVLVYIDLRTLNKLDVYEYPDTGKVNILPKLKIFYRGEQNISEIWADINSKK